MDLWDGTEHERAVQDCVPENVLIWMYLTTWN